jgi:hypothetical protein
MYGLVLIGAIHFIFGAAIKKSQQFAGLFLR